VTHHGMREKPRKDQKGNKEAKGKEKIGSEKIFQETTFFS
jgi:hypothetical protein